MPQAIDLCRFNFADVDIRRVGQTVDGGTSLSGIKDDIEADGGGYWLAEFTNGFYRDRNTGLDWRQVVDLGTTIAVDVLATHETLFGAPITQRGMPCPSAVLADDSGYQPTNDYTAAAAALRATTLAITTSQYAQPLRAGIIFAIQHATWGWRFYRLQTINGSGNATIRPPLREAITAATPLDFLNPRCQMRIAQQPSNPTNIGRYGQCAITFAEDMRKPA